MGMITLLLLLVKKMIRGATFCQVKRIIQFVQFIPSIISGNQKWKGAVPIFVIIAEFIIIVAVNLNVCVSIKIIDIIRRDDAKAWVIKYLIDDSEEELFFLLIIKGIILIRLISRPIHIPIQE